MYLSCQGLTMAFGGLTALDDVSFQMEQGEILGLIGPNGAGKTTVFNLLTGVYVPQAGVMTFRDRDLGRLSPRRRVRAGICRTFQNLRLFSGQSVLENVLAGSCLRADYGFFDMVFGTPRYFRRERALGREAMALLEKLDLTPYAHSPAGALPYGLQRRTELARALATGAELLLLDEPAAGMNEEEAEALGKVLRTLREEGKSLLLIEHHMSLVLSLCDRVCVLDRGRVLAQGPPGEATADPKVAAAFLGGGREYAGS